MLYPPGFQPWPSRRRRVVTAVATVLLAVGAVDLLALVAGVAVTVIL